MEEIDFKSDDFSDITARDNRYDARAYALLMRAVSNLSGDSGERPTGFSILEEFRETALDQYGPLAYAVLEEWGVKSCRDVGEMMDNLVEAHRLGCEDSDTKDAFDDGYGFDEAFLDPYAP